MVVAAAAVVVVVVAYSRINRKNSASSAADAAAGFGFLFVTLLQVCFPFLKQMFRLVWSLASRWFAWVCSFVCRSDGLKACATLLQVSQTLFVKRILLKDVESVYFGLISQITRNEGYELDILRSHFCEGFVG